MKATTENKELFTAGEWKVKGTSRSMQRLHVGTDETDIAAIFTSEPKAEENASLIAESKNMYQHIKWIVEYLKNADSVYIEKNSHMHRDCEEIINRINKQ